MSTTDDELKASRDHETRAWDRSDGDYTRELLSIAAGLRAVAMAIQELNTDLTGDALRVTLDDDGLFESLGRIADGVGDRSRESA